MAEYNFLTVWKFDAPLERVYAAIHQADQYHLWWKGQSPVETIEKGDAQGVGAVTKFCTKGILPYRLVYTGTVREIIPLQKIMGTTCGQLEGTGIWLFESNSGVSTVSYRWTVKTNWRWMNWTTPLLRPLFVWNHNIVMRWGGEGLANYLGCRLLT